MWVTYNTSHSHRGTAIIKSFQLSLRPELSFSIDCRENRHSRRGREITHIQIGWGQRGGNLKLMPSITIYDIVHVRIGINDCAEFNVKEAVPIPRAAGRVTFQHYES